MIFSRLLLLLVSAYILGSSLWVSYSYKTLWIDGYSIYYHTLLLSVLILAGLSFKEISLQRPTGKDVLNSVTLLVLGSLIWWVYRKPAWFADAIWFDEATQFLWKSPKGLIDFAATQQQPPIDYFLSNFAKLTLGISELSVVVHTLIFGVLSFIVFAFWLNAIRAPIWLSALLLLIFANHHILLRYSTEARPISIGIFFGLLVMFFIYESYKTKKMQTKPIFVSAVLLLLSMGLQPLFFLPLLALAFTPLLKTRFERPEIFKFCLATTIIPFAVVSPFIWKIYSASKDWNQFLPGSYWDRWVTALASLNLSQFEIFRSTFKPFEFLMLLPILLIFISALFAWRKRESVPKEIIGSILALVIFSVSFPILFQIFWSIINWPISSHYFVLWPMGTLALIGLALSVMVKSELFKSKTRMEGYFKAGVVILCLSVFSIKLFFQFIPDHRRRFDRMQALRPDWRALVQLAKGTERPSLFITIPYATPQPFGGDIFHHLTGKIYVKENHKVPILTNHGELASFPLPHPTYRITNVLSRFEKSSDIYFILRARDKVHRASLKNIVEGLGALSDEVLETARGYFVFKFLNVSSPIELTKKIYTKVVELAPEDDRSYYIQEALLAEYMREGNIYLASQAFLRINSMISRSVMAEDKRLNAYLKNLESQLSRPVTAKGEKKTQTPYN